MRLLGGVEYKVVGKEGSKRVTRKEEGISREEIKEVIRSIKDGKAMGLDGIPGEVWEYGGREEWVWNCCNRISRGEGWPDGWKEEAKIPIVKRREG